MKNKFEEILKKARKKFLELEEEWSNSPLPIDEINYYVEGEEEKIIEPKSERKIKKPRTYMSYAECVLEQVEKEKEKL